MNYRLAEKEEKINKGRVTKGEERDEKKVVGRGG